MTYMRSMESVPATWEPLRLKAAQCRDWCVLTKVKKAAEGSASADSSTRALMSAMRDSRSSSVSLGRGICTAAVSSYEPAIASPQLRPFTSLALTRALLQLCKGHHLNLDLCKHDQSQLCRLPKPPALEEGARRKPVQNPEDCWKHREISSMTSCCSADFPTI